MDWTKPPPKRVVTFALRCRSRITVSSPSIRGPSTRSTARWPKAVVTLSSTPDGALPAPTPPPLAPAARPGPAARCPGGGARRGRPGARAPASSDDDRHPRAAAHEPLRDDAGAVDRADVQDVAPARQPARELVAEGRAGADGEERPVGGAAAARPDEPLPAAVEPLAAVAVLARQPQA